MKHAKQTRAPWILLACLAAIALCIVAAVTLLQPNTNPKNIEIPGTRRNIPATIQLPAKSARGEELPLVVLDVQRGGPATGLPTKSEQTDLLQVLFGRNGESPMPVIAASSPTSCFDAAYMASKIALEHMLSLIHI